MTFVLTNIEVFVVIVLLHVNKPKGTNTENYLREFKAARTNKSREIGMREFKAELK
jgi:hypothetical protein